MGNCQTIDESKIQVPRQGVVRQVAITSYVWSKKYLGLFDYEAQEVERRRYAVDGNAVVLKDQERLIPIEDRFDRNPKHTPQHLKNALFRLLRNDNYYQLLPIVYLEKQELVQKPVWLVVRSLPNKSYSIRERDIFKLGKQKMRVREVVLPDAKESAVIPNDSIRLSKVAYQDLAYQHPLHRPLPLQQKPQQQQLGELERLAESKEIEIDEKQEVEREVPRVSVGQVESTATIGVQSCEGETCRICLQPGLITNPLITPCRCLGSVRYIHLLCLKQWLSKQIKAVSNDFSVTIHWKPLCCEMCKALYKYRIYLDNKKFYTVDIPKPQKPYLVIEVMKKRAKEEGRIFKFITFRHKPIVNIGRKKDVDVKISDDISVSRLHASLRYKPDTQEFLLQDNKSKFGTLVLAKNGLNLRPHHAGIAVQVGAELYEFQPLRQPSPVRAPNFDMAQEYMREEESEQSDEEEEEGQGSEEEDEVGQLPIVDDNDRSPSIHRSPSLRRSHSLSVQPADFR